VEEQYIQRGARYWVDGDGIIRGREVYGTAFELSDAQEAMELIRKLAAGRSVPLLMDITQLRSMSRDARVFFAQAAHKELLLAVALQVGSPFARAIGSIFLGFNRPAIPLKLFTDEAAALVWLRTFLPSASST
jgi:hypothetical protein